MSESVNLAALRSASVEGVSQLSLDTITGRSLMSAIDTMGKTALKGPLMDAIQGSDNALQTSCDLSHITGIILTNSGIKLPNNKFQSPQNAQLLREVAGKLVDPTRNLEVSIGLGGSEDPPSLRLPSYISPALDIVQAFLDRDRVPPIARFYNAHTISSAINGLTAEAAERRAEQASHLITNYVEQFYPDVAPYVQQETIDIAEIRAKGMNEDAQVLLDILHTPIQGLSSDELAIRQALEKLRRASAKHAGESFEQQELILCTYAAAHGITFHNYGNPSVSGVIKLGGQGEAPFDLIQQHMATRHLIFGETALSNIDVAGNTQLVNLRTKAGLLPPYYLERDAEGIHREFTVESTADDIPESTRAMADHYKAHGLRTGEDFLHLPLRIQPVFSGFARACIRQLVEVA